MKEENETSTPCWRLTRYIVLSFIYYNLLNIFIKKTKLSLGKRNFELGDPTLGLGSYFENSRHRAKRIETFCKQLVALGYNRALCDANEKERRRNLPLFSHISLNKGEEVNNNIKTSRMGSLTF